MECLIWQILSLNLFQMHSCFYYLKKIQELELCVSLGDIVKLKYLESYDPKKESKHMMYSDANNIYGYEMSKFFPTGGFKFICPEKFDSSKCSSNSLEVLLKGWSRKSYRTNSTP